MSCYQTAGCFTILACLFFPQVIAAQSTGIFTDLRDGQTYKTFSFKNPSTGTPVTWMAQNLNYKIQGSYAYNDNEGSPKELGLLYNWEAAKKACPIGWHLATDNEWSVLVNQFGGTNKAGEALKSVEGWAKDGNGNNSSGFNGLPGGQRRPDGTRNVLMGLLGFWWTSTPAGWEGGAWGWNLHFGGHESDKPLKSKVFRFDVNVSFGSSVRCVRN